MTIIPSDLAIHKPKKSLVDLMEKNKDVYMNYICPHCWFTLDNCICELFPPYYLIHIDKNIQNY